MIKGLLEALIWAIIVLISTMVVLISLCALFTYVIHLPMEVEGAIIKISCILTTLYMTYKYTK